jgi:hypothetical protein
MPQVPAWIVAPPSIFRTAAKAAEWLGGWCPGATRCNFSPLENFCAADAHRFRFSDPLGPPGPTRLPDTAAPPSGRSYHGAPFLLFVAKVHVVYLGG